MSALPPRLTLAILTLSFALHHTALGHRALADKETFQAKFGGLIRCDTSCDPQLHVLSSRACKKPHKQKLAEYGSSRMAAKRLFLEPLFSSSLHEGHANEH